MGYVTSRATIGGVETGCLMGLIGPADTRACLMRPVHIEIGDRHDMEAGGAPRLRQKHGAEFTGADQADADRIARRLPG